MAAIPKLRSLYNVEQSQVVQYAAVDDNPSFILISKNPSHKLHANTKI